MLLVNLARAAVIKPNAYENTMNREQRLSLDLTFARADVESLRLLLTCLKVEYAKQVGGNPQLALASIRDNLAACLSSLEVMRMGGDGRAQDVSDVARERAYALLLDAEERALQVLNG
jgi:hypothetical protein